MKRPLHADYGVSENTELENGKLANVKQIRKREKLYARKIHSKKTYVITDVVASC